MRDQPEVSYTEWEFEVATELGLPRPVFVLGEDTEGPVALTQGVQYGVRQDEFRARLAESGLTTAKVSSPAELETKRYQALSSCRGTSPAPSGQWPDLCGRCQQLGR